MMFLSDSCFTSTVLSTSTTFSSTSAPVTVVFTFSPAGVEVVTVTLYSNVKSELGFKIHTILWFTES